MFSGHAPIHSLTVPRRENGDTQGYCFVQLFCNNDVETVVGAMNGMKLGVGEASELRVEPRAGLRSVGEQSRVQATARSE